MVIFKTRLRCGGGRDWVRVLSHYSLGTASIKCPSNGRQFSAMDGKEGVRKRARPEVGCLSETH